MTQKLIIRNLLLGFLSWLIPFVVSLLFYKPGGELIVPYATFKSVILIVGTISGCYLLFWYFKFVDRNFIKNGIIVGLSWLALNIVFDILVLMPIMKSTFSSYFMSIGIGYVAIPVISITIGYMLNNKVKAAPNL